MGVTNLWALLEPCGRRIDVKALRGKRVAIDASGWIFKFIKAMRDDQGELLPNAHLIGFFRRICKLLFHNIRPIFIFDGSTPVLKRQTVAERRRRRDQQEARVKKTAEKLLLNRLKQHALAQATAQGQQIQGTPATINPQNAATNTVIAASTAINQQNEENEAGPSTSRPNLQPNFTNTNETAVAANLGTSSGGGVVTDADFEVVEKSDSDSELFDFEPMLPEGETIDPVVLATLPPSVQLEVMLRLRDRQQAANRGGFEERTGRPEEFSQFQINQYLKTSTLRRQLDTLRGAGAAANGAPRPVAAEEATEYVLERDEPEIVKPQQGTEGSQQPDVVSPTAAATASAAPKGIDLSFEIGMDEVVSDDGSLGWEDIEEDAPVDPGNAGRDTTDGTTPDAANGGGEGDEHWRERAARRQKYWSLSHGFQMGRKLAQWGENEGEYPQQKGQSPPKDSSAGGGVNEDEDSQLQEAIRRSLINDAPALGKNHAHEEQLARATALIPGSIVTAEVPTRDWVPQQQQHQVQQKQREMEIFETECPGIGDNENEPIRRQNIVHHEFVAPPPIAPVQAYSSISPAMATAATAAIKNNDGGIEEEVDIDIDTRKEEEVEAVRVIEEEKTEKVISIRNADPPVQPLLSTVEKTQIDTSRVLLPLPPAAPPQARVEEEEVQEDGVTEDDNNNEEVIMPSKQANLKPAAPRPLKVVRFTESEFQPEKQQEQQQDSVVEAMEAGNIAVIGPASSRLDPQASAPPQLPPPPSPSQDINEPSSLPSSQQEAAQYEDLLSTSCPQPQQLQKPQQHQPQPPLIPPLDHATLRKEEASLRAEHRAAAGQSDTPTDIMFAECQELLQLFGLPYLIAPSEAEAQAAWLDAAGLVDGVVTDDNDAFLFGARRLYRNIFEEAKYVEEYRTDELESELGLGRERLVNLALLLGSDYTAGVAGVGVVNAVEIVRAFEGIQGLERFAKWMKDVDEEIFALAKLSGAAAGAEDKNKNEVSEESEFEVIFKQTHKNVRKSWNLPSGFPSTEVVAAYLDPKVDQSKEKFTFARPDLDLLRHFCAQKFGWEQVRIDELLIPVLKAYDERQTQQTLDNFIALRSKFAKIRSKRLREAVAGITGHDNQELVLDEELAAPPAKVKKAVKAKAAPRQRKNTKKKNVGEEQVDEDDTDCDKEIEIEIDDEILFVEETPAPGTLAIRGRGRGRERGRGRGTTTTRRSRQGQEQQQQQAAAAESAEAY